MTQNKFRRGKHKNRHSSRKLPAGHKKMRQTAIALYQQDKTAEALPLLEDLLKTSPDDFELNAIMGHVLYKGHRFKEAVAPLEHALKHAANPQDARVVTGSLFAALRDGHELGKMLQMAETFFANPKRSAAETMMAFLAFSTVCDWKRMEALQKECFDLLLNDSSTCVYLTGFMMDLLGMDGCDKETTFALARKAGATKETAGLEIMNQAASQRCSGGRIKVAYLSGDFYNHPVGYFIYPLLAAHDRSRFEVYCYSNELVHDTVTNNIIGAADHYINVAHTPFKEVAQMMSDAGIHVAVDLGGNTESSLVMSFGYRPAPAQITYLGYAGTTGMQSVDFRISDHHAESEGFDQYYTEKLLYMPKSFICFGMRPQCERSVVSPVSKRGHITFGSFNNKRKMTPRVVKAWSKILNQVPDSHLILKTNWANSIVISNITAEFVEYGISPDRLDFFGSGGAYDEHVQCYNDVDIALDTFPYTGTTTTCEALWMGVPVVTLVGDAHVNRVSYSILKNIGFEETTAFSEEEYVNIAVDLAKNPDRLNVLRPTIHLMFAHSPVARPELFMPDLEALYLDACDKKGVNMKRNEGEISNIVQMEQDLEMKTKPADTPKRKLHKGGHINNSEWEILDTIPSDVTDHIGNANDLSMFENEIFDAVYSSHVLEHFGYQTELSRVLAEWKRVLKPGGLLYASVPNLEILCQLFLQKDQLNLQERFMVMRMIFGGQISDYDFHKVGYDSEILASFIGQAGFTNLRVMESFNLFQDTSEMEFGGVKISLNMIAEKPK